MPIVPCRKNGKPGYKYGPNNKSCFTYTPNNEPSRKAAKQKAIKQGYIIQKKEKNA